MIDRSSSDPGTEPVLGPAVGRATSVSSTALKALQVLEAVAAEPKPLRLAEVARATGMDKSLTHRMLATLVHAGYVHQDPETRRYTMGYRVVTLSRNLLAENEVVWPEWLKPSANERAAAPPPR